MAAVFIISNYAILSAGKEQKAREDIAKGEERYRRIFENMIDCYFEVDSRGIILKGVALTVFDTSGTPPIS